MAWRGGLSGGCFLLLACLSGSFLSTRAEEVLLGTSRWEDAPPRAGRRLVVVPPGSVLGGPSAVQFNALVGTVQAMQYSEREDLIFAGGIGRVVQFWRGADASLTATVTVGNSVSALAYATTPRQVVVARDDGQMLLVQVGDQNVAAQVLENPTGRSIAALEYLEYNDEVQNYVEVATASAGDNSIKLWSLSPLARTRVFQGHTRPVLVLRLLPAVELLASGGFDGLLGLWTLPIVTKLATGKECVGQNVFLSTASTVAQCLQAAIAAKGTYFILGLPNGPNVNQCHLEVGTCSELVDGSYTLYRIEQPKLSLRPAHDGAIRTLEPLPTLGLLASGGDDGVVRVWDPVAGTLQNTMSALRGTSIQALAYVSSVRALVAVTTSSLAFLDSITGELIKQLPRETGAGLLGNMNTHGMVAVPRGANIDFYPVVVPCNDGQEPVSSAQCGLCPATRAGSGGFCQIACGSGNTSNARRTACQPCALGTGGVGGTCTVCPPGRFQDAEGQVSCKRCQKGTAQPLSGQSACADCSNSTASQTVGLERCEDCPDGTEPSVDHTRCVQCAEGTAGRHGVCVKCGDGAQPSIPSLDECTPCPKGLAGRGGFCQLCPDGQEPTADRTSCKPCPDGFAGTEGVCARCVPGTTPAPGASFCMFCPPGAFGTNGTCFPCLAGFVPTAERSACYECPRGQPSVRGACTPCADGTYPASNRSACLACPQGRAGTDGSCNACRYGYEPNADQSACVACPDTWASEVGVCFPCANGTMPNETLSGCKACPLGRAGVLGRCLACQDGEEQSADRTSCHPCPPGFSGTRGVCAPCDYPLVQDATRTTCTLQVHPPYLSFPEPRCRSHASCAENFAHLPEMEAGRLFCCPTTDGVLLRCCTFETEAAARIWAAIASGADRALAFAEASAIWFLPAVSSLCLVAVGACGIRRYRAERFEDWRQRLLVSRGAWCILPLDILLLALVFPWLLVAVAATFWLPLLATCVLCLAVRRLRRLCWSEYDRREKAVQHLRGWILLLFLGDAFMGCVLTLHDLIFSRFLLADISNAIGYFTGIYLIRQTPFEELIDKVRLPYYPRVLVLVLTRGLFVPQVLVANIVVHIDLHAENVCTTVAVGAALMLGCLSAAYVLLACNLPGRLEAAKHAVLLSHTSPRRRVLVLGVLGLADFLLSLALHLLALWPARFGPLLAQLLPLRPLPALGPALAVPGSLALFALSVQLLALYLWVGVAGGSHVDNPLSWLASIVTKWSRIEFDSERRQKFLIEAVLRTLGMFVEEETSPRSAGSSPRSPRSPKGTGSSPKSSPRGGGFWGSSPRSPQHTPNVSPRSPRGAGTPGSPGLTAVRGPKIDKNLGSVRKMLMRHAGVDSPKSNSPRPGGGISPRRPSVTGSAGGGGGARVPIRGASPRSARLRSLGIGPGVPRTVRMPDGSRVSVAFSANVSLREGTGRNEEGRRRSVRSVMESLESMRSIMESLDSEFAGVPRGGSSDAGGVEASVSEVGKRRGSAAADEDGMLAVESRRRSSAVIAEEGGGGRRRASVEEVSDSRRKFAAKAGDARRKSFREVIADGRRSVVDAIDNRRKSMASSDMMYRRRSVWDANAHLASGIDETPRSGRRQKLRDLLCRTLARGGKLVRRILSPEPPGHGLARNRGEISLASLRVDPATFGGQDGQDGEQASKRPKMLPQQLYDTVPKPPYDFRASTVIHTFATSWLTAAWTTVGLWKERWNIGPHNIRLRTRQLARENFRRNYDRHDYTATRVAVAKLTSDAGLWFPLGAPMSIVTRHCNDPALRVCDNSLDISRHKMEEYLDRGHTYKEAAQAVRRLIGAEQRARDLRAHRASRVSKMLNMVSMACLLLLVCLLEGSAVGTYGPLLLIVACSCNVLHAALQRLVIPRVGAQRSIQIGTDRPLPEERATMKQVADAVPSSSSGSEAEGSSQDESSVGESFLEEDPRGTAAPIVLGSKRMRVLVRPKALRLRLRYQLLQGRAECGEHRRRWELEDPLKHGRLLHVPEGFPEAARGERTVSFQPREESDPVWNEQIRVRRARSIGTSTGEEACERRAVADHWAGAADVFDEHGRSGVPPLPSPGTGAVPPRGADDLAQDFGALRQASVDMANEDSRTLMAWWEKGTKRFLKKPWEECFGEGWPGSPQDQGWPLIGQEEAEGAAGVGEEEQDEDAEEEWGEEDEAEGHGGGEEGQVQDWK